MSAPKFNAWRFRHPDIDAAEGFSGLAFSNRGGIAMVDTQDSIRQAILILLTTLPGERLMRPAYGCDLQKLVFAPNDDTTAGLAIHYVRRALDTWEPRIQVLRLDAHNEPDTGCLQIVLRYRVRVNLREDQLALTVDVRGDSA
jgi:phage baseplate assembly protein W